MQGVLCTGRQERISAVAPTWAARASSDVANSDRGTGNNPRVDACVVNGAADLIEYGYDALLKRIGGESSAASSASVVM